MKRINKSDLWATIAVITVVVAMVIFSSCSSSRVFSEEENEESAGHVVEFNKDDLVPLSKNLLREYEVKFKELRLIQYYSGPDSIILERRLASKGSSINKDGQIVLRNNRIYERTVVAPYTPGIAVDVSRKGEVAIVFGKNPDNYFVWGPGRSGRYVLAMSTSGEDETKYGEEVYPVISGKLSPILVDVKNIRDVQSKDKVEPGRRVRN